MECDLFIYLISKIENGNIGLKTFRFYYSKILVEFLVSFDSQFSVCYFDVTNGIPECELCLICQLKHEYVQWKTTFCSFLRILIYCVNKIYIFLIGYFDENANLE